MSEGQESTLSVVKINAIEVPDGGGAELEQRFSARAKAVDGMPGFEGFELLRPVSGETRYFVYTKWATEEHFQTWLNSQAFQHGHAGSSGEGQQRPVATGSALLSFDVVDLEDTPG
jgi:heme-degrading monooxygenase HmoA